jgi:hypothetical protein
MAHVVFGAPGREHFALHERLRRELTNRGHRVSVLHTDAAAFLPWRRVAATSLLAPGTGSPSASDRELLRAVAEAGGDRSPAGGKHLARWLEASRRWFASAMADVLLLHQQRGPLARLLQFVALEAGCRVVWSGDGLLPHTLQVDDRGLDGDAGALGHAPWHYRVVVAERAFLDACLAHAFAAPPPFAPGLTAPQLWDDAGPWRTLPTLLRRHGPIDVLRALLAERRDHTPPPAMIPSDLEMPSGPYLAALLQADRDPRVRLDAAGTSCAALLAAAARTAARARLELVVLAPPGRRPRRLPRGCRLVPVAAAPAVVAAAAATLTINHPLAAVALLAGTPVVHAGRALYGLPGVTTAAPLAEFPAALQRAMHRDQPTLRQRFLTWVFRHGHVWCSAKAPDHNGMLGLVQTLTGRPGSGGEEAPRAYRAGPPWPLFSNLDSRSNRPTWRPKP